MIKYQILTDGMYNYNLKGTLCRNFGPLFYSWTISRHISKTSHVFRIFDFDLKSAQIFKNVPSQVLTKSYIGIDQIIYRNWQNCLLKSDMRFCQYWYKISAKPVHDLANNGIWFCQSQCTILEIQEYDFVNTGEDTFSKILGQNQRF